MKSYFKIVITALLSTAVFYSSAAMADTNAELFFKQKPMLQKIEQQNPALSLPALLAGVMAYDHLRLQGHDTQELITIVNFNRPSNEKRLWIIDMATGKVIYFTYVAQGVNTGVGRAKYFSNISGSDESSIGVYLTGNTYEGVAGHSMRLYGLDAGFDSNAFGRGIVMHPEPHVSKNFLKKYGQIGYTDGCFGLNKTIAPNIISLIKNGTVMVAFYPNLNWLVHSPYEQPL